MIKENKKLILILFVVLVMMAVWTIVNYYYKLNNKIYINVKSINTIQTKLDNNDVGSIDYDLINKDLVLIDEYVKDVIADENLDRNKLIKYYDQAQIIYENKINEIVRILNNKLDDEDYYMLQRDLADFYKNIDYAIEEIQHDIESTIDEKFYINKYLYEEKQQKCHSLIEVYKGFLDFK